MMQALRTLEALLSANRAAQKDDIGLFAAFATAEEAAAAGGCAVVDGAAAGLAEGPGGGVAGADGADGGADGGFSDPAVVLDRSAGRDADADAAEWAARDEELGRQRQAAQREKARRRAEVARAANLAARQSSRVSELRAAAAAAVTAADVGDERRTRALAHLHLLTHDCHTLSPLLVALQVPPANWPLSSPRDVATAYRLAALRFHPDRGRGMRTPDEAVFAEEAFKLIAKMKTEAVLSGEMC